MWHTDKNVVVRNGKIYNKDTICICTEYEHVYCAKCMAVKMGGREVSLRSFEAGLKLMDYGRLEAAFIVLSCSGLDRR